MHEVQTWDREEFSIHKALSEDERGGSAEVKQEDEGYSVSLKGRQATVHPYRQGMYAVIKEEEVKLISKHGYSVNFKSQSCF